MSREIIKDLEHNIIKIPLINKYKVNVGYTITDLDEYDKVKDMCFTKHISKLGKIYAGFKLNGKSEKLHIFIYGKAPEGHVVDHKNNDGLDNRKSNLRHATFSQNAQNIPKKIGKYSTDYKGVSYDPKRNKAYKAYIQVNNKQINIGSYHKAVEAAEAYDIYAVYHFGINAMTNGMLLEKEKEEIIKNGIPEEYKKHRKCDEDLPTNITRDKNGKYTCSVQRNKKRVHRYNIDTLEEAIKIKESLIKQLKIKIPDKPLNFNDKGEAVIILKDTNSKIVGETLVDVNLWDNITKFSWYLSGDGYVMGYPNDQHISLHQHLYTTYIGEIVKGKSVDHKDQNPLNNKLENLRLATPSLQIHNQKKRPGSICKYKGVSISNNKFVAMFNGVRYPFDTEESAALKYNELAKEKYGDDAYQNIIEDKVTTVKDYYPKEITREYISQIKTIVELKMTIKSRKWDGRSGIIPTGDMKISNIDDYKNKILEILDNEEINNQIIRANKLCNYKGVSMHGNKFVVKSFGKRETFDYLEDGARKYNEWAIEKLGKNTELNVVPNTKTTINDLIPDNMTSYFIENVKSASLMQQVVKKMGWGGGKNGHFSVRYITPDTLEDDKKKAIKLLTSK